MTGKKNKNRKVLFVTASTQGGGAERMLFNIISSLDCHIEKELVITSCDTPPQNRCIDYPTVSLRKKHALSSWGNRKTHQRFPAGLCLYHQFHDWVSAGLVEAVHLMCV